ncbi:peptidase S41 [Clostridium sp. MSJ-11]|uniref:Peptidase S41 n=1 Tax=Clostridium mobile TaxID=2841512 RepID=A0ABS6EMG8_9CLOT|nr:S41 family peptidase [Clostridium mobile]MBU5485831.1 peptidase S41 [Clostridium mobile]
MFKKILIPLVIILLCFSLAVHSKSYISRSGDRSDAWEKDIEYLHKTLPKKHKDLFFKIDEKEFDNKMENLKASVDKMNDEEIIVEIQKILASIGDAHTTINISAKKMFPLELYWFDDGIYVINTSDEYKDIKYSKLKKINGKDVDSVVKSIKEVISHENQGKLKSQVPMYITLPVVLQGLNIIENDETALFTFEGLDGKVQEIKLNTLDGDRVFDDILGKGKVGEEVPLYMKNRDEYYWFEHLEESKIIYFKYNQCANMKDKPFKEFSKELIDIINKNDIEKLVIDIRDNGGGSSRILNEFIDEISKSDINKKGKIYVVVGRKTFSSAILNAMSLKEKTEAFFIGEPTGGKPNHYGEVKSFKLPNSKITVRYSTKYFKHSDEDLKSFIPDKIIEPTVENYINNIDEVMKYIINFY